VARGARNSSTGAEGVRSASRRSARLRPSATRNCAASLGCHRQRGRRTSASSSTRRLRPWPWFNRPSLCWALAALSARIPPYRRISPPIRDSARTSELATHRIRKPNLRGREDKDAWIAPRRSAVRIRLAPSTRSHAFPKVSATSGLRFIRLALRARAGTTLQRKLKAKRQYTVTSFKRNVLGRKREAQAGPRSTRALGSR
jgi:hypothetical protein